MAAIMVAPLPLLAAGTGNNAKPAKAAQGYSVYKETGFEEQFDNPRETAEVDDLIELSQQLLRTASKLSKYHVPDALPMVTRISRSDLDRIACGEGATKCGVSALYEPSRGILFTEGLRPETNMFDRSILLHEMVHYLQEMGHSMSAAPACERWYQRELEAYAIQKQYLQSIQSPARVAYSGSRPTCDAAPPEALTHKGKEVKAPGLND
ncbi:MAG: hypothetical protein ABI794_08685 [Betaproteobacteria bacterium]